LLSRPKAKESNHEQQTKITTVNSNLVLVPLSKLKKSPKNVREMLHTSADIEAIAASVTALCMLQYPVVEAEHGRNGKTFSVGLSNLRFF